MRITYTLLLVFLCYFGFTQTLSLDTGETYAVVVGISDYQDEQIPDLRFADKDALAFAGFLQSPAGGELDEDHLKVLINEQATQAQFGAALDWLWEVAAENDKVIIYFSGHGDVERKSITQPGYLLCWDAPPNVYMGGGAFNVRDLNDVVSTISIQNKAKVLLVTDACRAGKLSGSGIGGSQATAANLAKQYGNEIKILSCQPDEYSIEGEQWGGGRGAFSYHLLDGLYGLADGNNDLSVNLLEIGRYLEDHVSTEVAPHSQIPMTVGGRGEKLTTIFPEILAQIKEGKRGQMQLFTATESRGIEDDVLAAVDPITEKIYKAFKRALKEKQFLAPTDACADVYYEILIKEPKMERLHSSMRRNYAAALQDDAQQVLNNWLKAEINEINLSRISKKTKYKPYPRYLEKAAELLGKQHYMYAVLMARKLYFEGYMLSLKHQNYDKELGEAALEKFRGALLLQPDMPHAYESMSSVFGYNLLQPDSAEVYAQKAISLNPSWIFPYYKLASLLWQKYKQFELAELYLEQGIKVDSNSNVTWTTWGSFYRAQKEFTKAEIYYKKSIQLDSTYIHSYNNLGRLYSATRRYDLAEQYYKKSIQLDSTYIHPYNNLGNVYKVIHRYDLAEQYYLKSIQLDSNYIYPFNNLGRLYSATHRYDLAEQCFLKVIQLDSNYAAGYKSLGILYTAIRRYDLAEQFLKKAIQIDTAYVFAFNDLGLLYTNMERYEEGIYHFKRAIHFDPTFSVAYKDLALLYKKTGQNAEAINYLKKGIQINTADVISCYELSKLYYEMDRPEEAETINQLNLRNNSTNPSVEYGVACLKSLYQIADQAFHYLEEALKKGYNNFNWMQEDGDLANLRKQKQRWDTLMQKYFPDQHKK